ncbi:hypothetical protein [Salegentibacter holothuriorum]|uniref:hypothetical protein n=1 Tax=Salegentibacter holothuriorum TaxID=241145 RepID=UPI0009A8A6D4|nr:hypothetical protein [Salegentibacter holothuriorum]
MHKKKKQLLSKKEPQNDELREQTKEKTKEKLMHSFPNQIAQNRKLLGNKGKEKKDKHTKSK